MLKFRLSDQAGSTGVSGGVGPKSSIKELTNALPRFPGYGLNSKYPKYSGNYSREIPQYGRSRYRQSDQKSSGLLTWTA